jgi:8-oxo-dGTP diphosphatase
MKMGSPGAKAFVVFNKKLMFILRDDNPNIPFPNTWNLPGGGVEDDESPEAALIRELKEEINITPKKVTFLGEKTYQDGEKVYRFLVKLNENEYKSVRLGDEGQKIEFFGIDELGKIKLSPHSKEYFDSHEVQIKKLIEEESNLSPEELGLIK